jgi:enoyl-CoA hydratase/carnithine racemase
MTHTTHTPDISEIGNEQLRVEASEDSVVTTATIDRPDVRNAMNPTVAAGLREAVAYADASPTRVLVVRGADGTFCSGGDLGAMEETRDATAFRDRFSILTELATRLANVDALVVAGVEGHCLAGGMGLAAACDFVVAADDATFGTPEIDVGLFPMQAMAPIMRSTHMKQGLELLFTGEFIDADEAHELGVVTKRIGSETFDVELASGTVYTAAAAGYLDPGAAPADVPFDLLVVTDSEGGM